MRIATWNVERLKRANRLEAICSSCEEVNADILVLTETDGRLTPQYHYCFSTTPLTGRTAPALYADTENRVSVFTNYRCITRYKTHDDATAVCVELETERGNLVVYGTIIGIQGNRNKSFSEDIFQLRSEIKRLSASGNDICLIGDFNCSFADNYYHTESGRKSLMQCFSENHLTLLTAQQKECIDHIAVSDTFMRGLHVKSVTEWNSDKNLSDHKGILIEIDDYFGN